MGFCLGLLSGAALVGASPFSSCALACCSCLYDSLSWPCCGTASPRLAGGTRPARWDPLMALGDGASRADAVCEVMSAWPSGPPGQQGDNRRTRSGDRLAALAKLHTRRSTSDKDNRRRTTPGHSIHEAKDCGRLLFSANSVYCLGGNKVTQ